MILWERKRNVVGDEYGRPNTGASITGKNSGNGALPTRESARQLAATANRRFEFDKRRAPVNAATLCRRVIRGIRRERSSRSNYGMSIERKELMRRIIVFLVCVMIAPLAFAQPVPNTSVVKHTGQTTRAPTQITTGAVKVGTVTAFNPGLRPVDPPSPIVVQSSPDTKPVSYMLGKRVRFVDKDGGAFDPRLVRPGTRVKLGFDRRGRVSLVVVVERE